MTLSSSILNAWYGEDEDKDWVIAQLVGGLQTLERRLAELEGAAPRKDENLFDLAKREQARRNIGIPDGDDSNNALVWDGSEWTAGAIESFPPGSDNRELTRVEYLTPGAYTWNIPASATFCWVIVIGAGGGSNASSSTVYVASSSGGTAATPMYRYYGGGGGGGAVLSWFNVTDASSASLFVGGGYFSASGDQSYFSLDGVTLEGGGGAAGGDLGGGRGGYADIVGSVGSQKPSVQANGHKGNDGFWTTVATGTLYRASPGLAYGGGLIGSGAAPLRNGSQAGGDGAVIIWHNG